MLAEARRKREERKKVIPLLFFDACLKTREKGKKRRKGREVAPNPLPSLNVFQSGEGGRGGRTMTDL